MISVKIKFCANKWQDDRECCVSGGVVDVYRNALMPLPFSLELATRRKMRFHIGHVPSAYALHTDTLIAITNSNRPEFFLYIIRKELNEERTNVCSQCESVFNIRSRFLRLSSFDE